ncbi:hypothetical protein E3N88_09801 [Mikania micrantha]|uniref:F-box domain-containing protein n=1 Tax=Mikania micrantha TaxID=192012 RepID=A0A5N6PN63_9ASTR|nr:hypothetical protein E3N88_09801 [Mikania micrantha]
MWAEIPLEIQVEIIKRVPVKSLIRFRSVSKQWKTVIDSSEFISDHCVNQSQPHQLLVTYSLLGYEKEYVSVVDDDSFPCHKYSPALAHNVKLVRNPSIVGCSNGLAEVFTFTSGAWRSISMKTLPCHFLNNPVVINGVIHWIVFDLTRKNGEENRMITFDLTIEEFGEVDLPVQVVGCTHLDISKLNDSLVVLHYHSSSRGGYGCDIWMMLNPKSSLFTKLYTVKASPHTIVGFRKNGNR